MCDPISIGIAVTLAGTLATNLGQQKAARAQEQAQNAERARQMKLTAEQQGYFDDTLAKVSDASSDDSQAKAAAARNNTLQAAIAPAAASTEYMPGLSAAPAVVQGAADRGAASGRASSVQLAQAIAALGGTGDALQGLNIDAMRNRQRTAQTGSFKAGSSGVLQDELSAAAQQGGTLRGLGGLATQIGTMAIGSGVGTALSGAGRGASGLSKVFQAARKTPLVNLAKMGGGLTPFPIGPFG